MTAFSPAVGMPPFRSRAPRGSEAFNRRNAPSDSHLRDSIASSQTGSHTKHTTVASSDNACVPVNTRTSASTARAICAASPSVHINTRSNRFFPYTSFRELLDEIRSQVAMKYLRDTVMTSEDIAVSLGFSDAANFRHAFLRWTGKSPSEFRESAHLAV